MALFTDELIAKLEDLAEADSSILDMASTEKIDLSAKLRLAQEQIGLELTAAALRPAPYGTQPLSLQNVAVTPTLRLWHVFQTLVLAYGEARGNQGSDRYETKRKYYLDLAQWAFETLHQVGVGIVFDPLPVAEAPILAYTAGPQEAATYYVRVSWTNAAGEEGMPSAMGTISTPSGSLLTVRCTGHPRNGAGWNVYAGLNPDGLTLQNAAPLGHSETWTEPGTGLVAGRTPGAGQEANCLRGLPRVLQRG